MTDTATPTDLVAATSPGDDREAWLEARTSRVTASQIHEIAVGGRATHMRILADKLNGSTFKGNQHTKRGHEREPFLLDFAREFIDPDIAPNAQLYVHPVNDRIGATPDGLAVIMGQPVRFGVEVKSLDYGATQETAPPNHYDQCQLGMYVTGCDRWLYLWEVMGEDGEPTLEDPRYVWIERDEHRIKFLVREAERFLAWWDAGAPATDDLPADLDDALAAWADARDRKKAAEADEKAADAIIRRHIAATEGADTDGLKLAGRAAQLVYTVTPKEVLDPEAWAAAEPDSHAAWIDLQTRAADAAETATALYSKTTVATRLNITPTKDAA